MRKDILSYEDVKVLVDEFYSGVRKDDLLAPVFEAKLRDRWPEHLEKMYRFWGTILLGEHSYQGNPFAPHVKLPLEKDHFDRWIILFIATVEKHFSGAKAEEARQRAGNMAEMFYHKHHYFKHNPDHPVHS